MPSSSPCLLNMELTPFSPSSAYPNLNPDRHTCLAWAFHNSIHPLDHRVLQPSLRFFRKPCIALHDHLIVADEHRHGPWALASTFPQEGQRELQTISCGSLDRRVEAVRVSGE
jgi:hypothetical protein